MFNTCELYKKMRNYQIVNCEIHAFVKLETFTD